MAHWYYNNSGLQHGPVTESEIQSLLENHRISHDTLVWSEGMEEWKPASTITIFQVSPYAAPSSDLTSDVNWSGYTPSGSQVRPWVRYWARSADFLVFCLVGGIIAMIIWPQLGETNDTLLGIILLLAYNFVEPMMLASLGTTPFKWLLCIRVRNHDDTKLSYLRGLHRTFSVWLRGQGLGVPLIALFTCISSYKRLTTDGITSWDSDGGFTVSHQTVSWWRWLVFIGFISGFIALLVLGSES